MLRTISVERFLRCHVIDTFMQGFDHDRRQRPRYVSDAHADDAFLRMRRGIGRYLTIDIGEQIALLQILIMCIDLHKLLLTCTAVKLWIASAF